MITHPLDWQIFRGATSQRAMQSAPLALLAGKLDPWRRRTNSGESDWEVPAPERPRAYNVLVGILLHVDLPHPYQAFLERFHVFREIAGGEGPAVGAWQGGPAQILHLPELVPRERDG